MTTTARDLLSNTAGAIQLYDSVSWSIRTCMSYERVKFPTYCSNVAIHHRTTTILNIFADLYARGPMIFIQTSPIPKYKAGYVCTNAFE